MENIYNMLSRSETCGLQVSTQYFKKKRKKVTHSYSLVYTYFTNCCSAHYEKNSEICMWRSNFTELWSGTTGTLINSNLTGILNDQFSKTIATFSFLYVMFQMKHIIMILEHFNYELEKWWTCKFRKFWMVFYFFYFV